MRFERPSPLAVVSRLWCPNPGGTAPSASKIWICTAGIGDVVLAAHDVRDAEVDVVDH